METPIQTKLEERVYRAAAPGREIRPQAEIDPAADCTRPEVDRPGREPEEGGRPFQSRAEDLIPVACNSLSRFTVPVFPHLQVRQIMLPLLACCWQHHR